jgi:hypothetical protein
MWIACVLVPFALAAGILFIIDRWTLRKTLSAGERKAVVDSCTSRWLRYYGFFFFLIAVMALFVNAFRPRVNGMEGFWVPPSSVRGS